MAQKLKGAKTETGLSAARVTEFLQDNPDFFIKHPEVLNTVSPPTRELGGGVADLQQAMIDRLRDEIAMLSAERDSLVGTSRANMQTQSRIHGCVLAILGAKSFEHLIQTVTNDFAMILDLDIVTLCIESTESESQSIKTRGLVVVPPGTVENILGNRRLVLRNDVTGDPELFDAGATLVRSDAVVRLDISESTPPALLAFGSREPDRFETGQATELLDFLASVLEHVVRIWLQLSE